VGRLSDGSPEWPEVSALAVSAVDERLDALLEQGLLVGRAVSDHPETCCSSTIALGTRFDRENDRTAAGAARVYQR